MKNQYIKYINAIIQNRLETMPREMEIISLNLLFPLPMDHKQTNKQNYNQTVPQYTIKKQELV